jgi:hypothetical protein
VTVLAALTLLGWIIVLGLLLCLVLSIVYWRGRRPTADQIEDHELREREHEQRPDPPGWSPH